MKKNLRLLAGAALGVVVALGFSSCAYDPYYSSAAVGVSSGGYGAGYGYGSPGFSTSVFVGTGNPQWGYDPTCHSYYDYRRRCYYDPYLNGYYPVGYRPAVVYGVPHPHGWRAGVRYIRPPVYVKNVTVTNYHNRAVAYQNTNYSWAKQVRQQPVSTGRVVGSTTQTRGGYNNTRTTAATHTSQSTTKVTSQSTRQTTKPASHPSSTRQAPSRSSSTAVKSSSQTKQRVTSQHPGTQRPNAGRQSGSQNGRPDSKQKEKSSGQSRTRGVH